jgi:hypothetical protein
MYEFTKTTILTLHNNIITTNTITHTAMYKSSERAGERDKKSEVNKHKKKWQAGRKVRNWSSDAIRGEFATSSCTCLSSLFN